MHWTSFRKARFSSILLCAILVFSMAFPSAAVFAAEVDESDSSEASGGGQSAGQETAENVESFEEWSSEAGTLSGSASAVETLSDENDAATSSEAPMSIQDFSRAQKGSNRSIAYDEDSEEVYQGYAFYVGSEKTDFSLVATDSYVVVYVDKEAAEEFGSLEDEGEGSFRYWLESYLLALDDVNSKGSGSVSADETWYFTTSNEIAINGVLFKFNQEYKSGSIYASVIGEDGSDVTTSDNQNYVQISHADFGNFVANENVVITESATGLAAVQEFLENLDWRPLWVTLKTTLTAIVFVFILGLLAAWWSMRISPRAQDIADSIFTIPMVLPPTVCGFVLLLLLGKNTAVGNFFINIGFPLVFSWPATVIAATVVAFPLMYRSARGAFEGIDPNMLDAARTLGWSEWRIFFRLMLPLTWSSIAAGTVLSFARALGEFGATLFLAGNYAGITRTISIAIYFEWMNGNMETALFWTGVILVFSFFVILFINLWSRRTTKYRRKEN